jgi:butyrate kinase
MDSHTILAVNPGSTSTKIAVFRDGEEVFTDTQRYDTSVIQQFHGIMDQEDFRYEEILKVHRNHGISLEDLDCVVGRGGLLKPIPGGTCAVGEPMLKDLRSCRYGAHASNLGAPLALRLGKGKPAFIVDPVVVDEMVPPARLSGHPEIPRISIFHALNQKAVGHRAARDLGIAYEEAHLVIAHMGGGISVGAHCKGRVVDVNNALDGDGPFSPERAGALPSGELAKLCFSGSYTYQELRKKLVGQGGMVAHLGTNDLREAEKRIAQGDARAELVVDAMAYQVAKEMGSRAVALEGKMDALVLTGGLAYSEHFVQRIRRRIEWMGSVLVYPGEDEMRALAEGGLRVLRGEEQPQSYEG